MADATSDLAKEDAMAQCMRDTTGNECPKGCQRYTDCVYDLGCTTGDSSSSVVESIKAAKIFGCARCSP